MLVSPYRVGGPGPAFVVEAFALLAVATSFIGSVLGLSEFLLEQLGKAQSPTVGEGTYLHQITLYSIFSICLQLRVGSSTVLNRY